MWRVWISKTNANDTQPTATIQHFTFAEVTLVHSTALLEQIRHLKAANEELDLANHQEVVLHFKIRELDPASHKLFLMQYDPRCPGAALTMTKKLGQSSRRRASRI